MNSKEFNLAIRYKNFIKIDSRWLVIFRLIVIIIAASLGIVYASNKSKLTLRNYVADSILIIGILILGTGVNNSIVPFIPYSAAKTDEQLIHNKHAIRIDKWKMNISAGPGVDVPGSYGAKNENSSNSDMIKRIHFDKTHQPQKPLLMKIKMH